MSVLVVDSDQIFCETIINLLLICGIVAYTVTSSWQEALEKASGSAFDIILINVSRPDINGLQLVGELKIRNPDSRIILIVEDEQLSAPDNDGLTQPNLTTILKSSVNHILPQLLSRD